KEELTSSFVVDEQTGTGEMPGVTKLLNRKSFTKTATSAPAPVAAEPEAVQVETVDEDGATLVVSPAPGIELSAEPAIQKPKRRRTAETKPLVEWTHATLKA